MRFYQSIVWHRKGGLFLFAYPAIFDLSSTDYHSINMMNIADMTILDCSYPTLLEMVSSSNRRSLLTQDTAYYKVSLLSEYDSAFRS